MNALLFPGQGTQIVGMGSEFYNNFDLVKKIFSEADEKLQYSISKIILESKPKKVRSDTKSEKEERKSIKAKKTLKAPEVKKVSLKSKSTSKKSKDDKDNTGDKTDE